MNLLYRKVAHGIQLKHKGINVLLLGGYKKGQQKNIDKAKEYWREYSSLRKVKNEKTKKS